jgi:hypothetical protein
LFHVWCSVCHDGGSLKELLIVPDCISDQSSPNLFFFIFPLFHLRRRATGTRGIPIRMKRGMQLDREYMKMKRLIYPYNGWLDLIGTPGSFYGVQGIVKILKAQNDGPERTILLLILCCRVLNLKPFSL